MLLKKILSGPKNILSNAKMLDPHWSNAKMLDPHWFPVICRRGLFDTPFCCHVAGILCTHKLLHSGRPSLSFLFLGAAVFSGWVFVI